MTTHLAGTYSDLIQDLAWNHVVEVDKYNISQQACSLELSGGRILYWAWIKKSALLKQGHTILSAIQQHINLHAIDLVTPCQTLQRKVKFEVTETRMWRRLVSRSKLSRSGAMIPIAANAVLAKIGCVVIVCRQEHIGRRNSLRCILTACAVLEMTWSDPSLRYRGIIFSGHANRCCHHDCIT